MGWRGSLPAYLMGLMFTDFHDPLYKATMGNDRVADIMIECFPKGRGKKESVSCELWSRR
jgi:hypothetical protein